jgi:hypothetical protein
MAPQRPKPDPVTRVPDQANVDYAAEVSDPVQIPDRRAAVRAHKARRPGRRADADEHREDGDARGERQQARGSASMHSGGVRHRYDARRGWAHCENDSSSPVARA